MAGGKRRHRQLRHAPRGVLLLTACALALVVQDGTRAAPADPAPSPSVAGSEQPTPDVAKQTDPASPLGARTATATPTAPAEDKDFETFLDRLMLAESGGNDVARNARSTAVGAYQLLRGTLLHVVRRHMAAEIAGMSEADILALRLNRAFSRRVAAAYTRDNAQYLVGEGLTPTYGNLRLAYLLGPAGAARVLRAEPQTPVAKLVGPIVVRANPFMASMTAETLTARAAREISLDPAKRLAVTGEPGARPASEGPRIKVTCNLSRPACQHWLALQKQKLQAAGKSRTRHAKGT